MDRLFFSYMGYKEKTEDEIINELNLTEDISNIYKEFVKISRATFFNGNFLVTSFNSYVIQLRLKLSLYTSKSVSTR